MTIEIQLLGGFRVTVDGSVVPDGAWRRRHAAGLVKLLALAPNRTLHREQVIDALWPELTIAEAAPRLHKAAYFARRALGRDDGVVLSADLVTLFPDADVAIDVATFEAVAASDPDKALELCTGPLLPADPYEDWIEGHRTRLHRLHTDLLRRTGRWEELVAREPCDEGAHLELMRRYLDEGDRAAALRQYEALARALRAELDADPSAAAQELRDRALVVSQSTSYRQPGQPALTQTIRFCRATDGVRLAYAEVGEGMPFVRAAHWLTHLEYDWESIVWHHWLHGFGQRYRFIRYDERGCGLSDWDIADCSLEAWVRDLETVVDAVGLDRFPLLGVSQGGAVAVEYAARHPERVSHLVLYGAYVHGRVRRAHTDEQRRAASLLPELAELGWGSDDPAFRQVFTARFMPEGTREQWEAFNELQRRTTSPENAGRFLRTVALIDITEAAKRVTAPTLVLHARHDLMPPLEQGRQLAALIPGSRFVSLESRNHILLEHEPAWQQFLDEIDRFLAA